MQAAAQGGSAAGIGGRNAWGSRLQMPIPQDDSVGITARAPPVPLLSLFFVTLLLLYSPLSYSPLSYESYLSPLSPISSPLLSSLL